MRAKVSFRPRVELNPNTSTRFINILRHLFYVILAQTIYYYLDPFYKKCAGANKISYAPVVMTHAFELTIYKEHLRAAYKSMEDIEFYLYWTVFKNIETLLFTDLAANEMIGSISIELMDESDATKTKTLPVIRIPLHKH